MLFILLSTELARDCGSWDNALRFFLTNKGTSDDGWVIEFKIFGWPELCDLVRVRKKLFI